MQHSFSVGQYVDALDVFPNKYTGVETYKWRVASIVDVATDSVKIHWEGWKDQWDCWLDITTDGHRVKPLGQQTVGGSKEALALKKLEEVGAVQGVRWVYSVQYFIEILKCSCSKTSPPLSLPVLPSRSLISLPSPPFTSLHLPSPPFTSLASGVCRASLEAARAQTDPRGGEGW